MPETQPRANIADMTPEQKLEAIKSKLNAIMDTEGEDAGVIMLDAQGSCKWDADLKCNVYKNRYFSPLGDALMEIYELVK